MTPHEKQQAELAQQLEHALNLVATLHSNIKLLHAEYVQKPRTPGVTFNYLCKIHRRLERVAGFIKQDASRWGAAPYEPEARDNG